MFFICLFFKFFGFFAPKVLSSRGLFICLFIYFIFYFYLFFYLVCWLLDWMVHWYTTFSIVVEPCNCDGKPQCFVCDSVSAQQCETDKQLVTCPNANVSLDESVIPFRCRHKLRDHTLPFAIHLHLRYRIQNAVDVCCALCTRWTRTPGIPGTILLYWHGMRPTFCVHVYTLLPAGKSGTSTCVQRTISSLRSCTTTGWPSTWITWKSQRISHWSGNSQGN